MQKINGQFLKLTSNIHKYYSPFVGWSKDVGSKIKIQ